MRTLICYLTSVVGAGAIGGLTLGLMVLQLPLWLNIIVWGAAFPLYLLALVVYLGGLYGAWKSIFGDAGTAPSKDA